MIVCLFIWGFFSDDDVVCSSRCAWNCTLTIIKKSIFSFFFSVLLFSLSYVVDIHVKTNAEMDTSSLSNITLIAVLLQAGSRY